MQTGCPLKLRLRGHFEGTKKDEEAIHQKLSRYRVRGEWFRDRPEVYATFLRHFGHNPDVAPSLQDLRDAIALLNR